MYFFIFTSNLFPVIFILNSFLNVCYTYFYKSVFTLKHVYIRGNKPFSYVTLFQKKKRGEEKTFSLLSANRNRGIQFYY